jgi:pyrrolidone-carboxylate peptidase
VTSFGPFAGRGKNGSTTIARSLRAGRLAVELKVIELPVVWGEVERRVLPVVRTWKPDVLVGIGEGRRGYVAFETRAVNARAGADEKGDPPPGGAVVDGAPAELISRLTFEWSREVRCAFPIVLSRNAGRYLCNNALYVYLRTKVPRAGFVHVPPQGKADDRSYLRDYAPVVEAILRQNARRAREKANEQREAVLAPQDVPGAQNAAEAARVETLERLSHRLGSALGVTPGNAPQALHDAGTTRLEDWREDPR